MRDNVSEMDKLVEKLSERLKKNHANFYSPKSLEGILTAPEPALVQQITQLFYLPEVFKEFLRKYLSKDIILTEIEILRAELLLKQQQYLDRGYVAIGRTMLIGDPIMFKIQDNDQLDATVYTAMHDNWLSDDDVEIFAPSFLSLIKLQLEQEDEVHRN